MMKISTKLRDTPQPVLASLAFFAVSVIEKGLFLLTSPIYTRLLTQSEFGTVSVFLSWQGLLGVAAMFCLSAGVFNNGMLDYEKDRDGFSFSMLILSNVITIICFAILSILWPDIKTIFGIDLPLLCLMFLFFLTQPAFAFWMARQRFEYKYKQLSLVVITYALLSQAAAITCIYLFPAHRVYGRLFGGEGALLCVYGGFYLYIASKAGWKLNTSYWKAAVLFNLPLIPHYLSGYLLNSSDRIMIANLVGSAAAAKYSVAYTVALAVTIVWNAINGSLIPYTYQKCRGGDYESIAEITAPIISFYLLLCAALILFAPEIIMIMAPASYFSSVYIVPPIVGGIFFMSMYSIFANVVYYYKKPKYVMYASVSAAALNIALNWLFIPVYGYAAAAYTTLFCYIVQAVFDYHAMKKAVGAGIYDMRLIISLSAVMIIISLGSSLLYQNDALRYGVILSLFLSAVLFRRKIVKAAAVVKNKTKI